MPNSLLTNPKLADAFVYAATIQRMAINLCGRDAVLSFAPSEDRVEDDADKLDIPVVAAPSGLHDSPPVRCPGHGQPRQFYLQRWRT
jgi:hypothetical protein